MLKVGSQAPDFTITIGSGDSFTLSEHRGRNVVLFFYPMAFTPGCSAEVGGFCESYGDISAWNAVVLGISTNSVETVKRFARKMETPFPMGSDTKGRIRRLYGAEKWFGLVTSRVTYVIDGEGVIRGAFHSEFVVSSHIQNALQTLESLAKG
ncbi:MAG: peroxiredoxin [Chloroflexi bacterium]|nr:peroxiredoxin [Chloroflexota bacterium]